MDENYLDNLLNEFSLDKEIDNKIEDELDSQMAREKRNRQRENMPSHEELFNSDLEFDADIDTDDSDLLFSEEQFDELDKLDDLADIDMDGLDFSDIDFDDLDMTKLDELDTGDLDELIKDFESDFEIDEEFQSEADAENHEEESSDVEDRMETQPEEESSKEERVAANENLNADDFDPDAFLDSLLEDAQEEEAKETPIVDLDEQSKEEETDYDAMQALEGFSDFGKVEDISEETSENPESDGESLSLDEEASLDDLFSLLDLDEEEGAKGNEAQSDSKEPGMEALDDAAFTDVEGLENLTVLSDIDDVPEKKKKKSLSEILFGEPDEDDESTEEELAAATAKKAEKKAKKKAAKEAKKEKSEAAKAERELKDGQKKRANDEKKRLKAEKKAKKKAEELANAEPEKKLNKPAVFFIFSVFLGGVALFYLATNDFNYRQVIEKATMYFENQKYHKAYDEIKGVEVKEKDQDLKDRIYTVMYVERLYESYENNVKLGFQEKALDSLLRGVDKYYEHYEEAVSLGITADLDYSFAQIQTTLAQNYGITVERALSINDMENDEYVKTIREYVGKGFVDNSDSEDTNTSDDTADIEMPVEDAALPEEQKEEVVE